MKSVARMAFGTVAMLVGCALLASSGFMLAG
jgi:hypothetical protein